MTHDADDAISVAKCAKHYALSTRTVYRMIDEGLLPAECFGNYVIDWNDVWSLEQGPTPRPSLAERYKTDLLSRAGLARKKDRCVKSVDRWIAAGMPTRNVGASVRINRHDADDWLKGHYAGKRQRRKPPKRASRPRRT